MRQIEILAPAGSMPALKAAVFAGADAVYLGGRMFGARAYADNFSEEELLQAIDFAHLYGKKVYLTVNTLIKEKEMRQNLFDYLKPYVRHGLDAVIVQDLGAVHEIHRWFPMLPIHASTQMTITSPDSILMLAGYGVNRIVTSRELSLDEIKNIRQNSDIEIESFVHGALCFCYSGQCLLSSMIGGRSGNRGRCAQPCRMKYKTEGKEGCIMSMKDMCTLDIIPDLIEAGIDSFKIEGRMKGPEYAAYTSYLYRKYTDKYLELGENLYNSYLEKHKGQFEEEKKHLLDIYNRGNFIKGYYQCRNGKNMLAEQRPGHNGLEIGNLEKVEKRRVFIRLTEDVEAQDILEIRGKDLKKDTYEFTVKGPHVTGTLLPANYSQDCRLHAGQKVYRTKNNSLLQKIRLNFIEKEKKIPLQGCFTAIKDKEVEFTVADKTVSCTIRDQRPETAKKQPSEKEEIVKRLKKTGNTPFYFENLEVTADEDIFLPVGKLNEWRRESLKKFAEKKVSLYRRNLTEENILEEKKISEPEKKGGRRISATITNNRQFELVLTYPQVERIYFDLFRGKIEDIGRMSEKARANGKEFYVCLPHIFRKQTKEWLQNNKACIACAADGYLVRNLEEIACVNELFGNCNMVLDYNIYIWNSGTVKFFKEQGIKDYTVPLELNKKEAVNIINENSTIVVYGFFPVMVTAQCFFRENGGCSGKAGMTVIKDRKSAEFCAVNNCTHCYNVIYSDRALYLPEVLKEPDRLCPGWFRLDFFMEDTRQMKKVLDAFFNFEEDTPDERLYTKGHWKRGVE